MHFFISIIIGLKLCSKRVLLRSAVYINKINICIVRNLEITVKEEFEDTEYAHLPPFQEHDSEDNPSKPSCNSKRRLRSCRVSSVDESRQLRSYDEGKQDGGNLSR